jgi:hypothetical protein
MSMKQRVQQCSEAVVGLLSLATLAGATNPQIQQNVPTAGGPQQTRSFVPNPTQPGQTVRENFQVMHTPQANLALQSKNSPRVGENQPPREGPTSGATCSDGACGPITTQSPNGFNGYFSDSDYAGQYAVAEDFVVPVAQRVCEVTFWGAYYPSDTTPADDFSILVHADAGGIPGAVVWSETGVAPARFQTSVVLFGVHEWQYSWIPAGNLSLGAGTYWLEIYQNNAAPDIWFWETGNFGATYSGHGQSQGSFPGAAWGLVADDLSFVVCGDAAGGGGFTCADSACATQCLQDPNQTNGWFCDCTYGLTNTDDFTLGATKDICSITYWGGYYPTNGSPADSFTISVRADAGGFPGATLYSESGVAPARFQTGIVLFGVNEWQYEWIPATTLRLAAGTYWLEIYHAGAGGDVWFWEVGNLGSGKIDGHYLDSCPSGGAWGFQGDNLSMAVCGQDQATQGCVSGFIGDTTIAGGWDAFETLVGKDMEVLSSGLPDQSQCTDIPWSRPGTLNLNPAHQTRTVGISWATWSHGYQGEIFWTQGATSATLTMPNSNHQVSAFDCYIEPNPFSVNAFTVTGTAFNGDTTTITVTADGASGASHFGIYTTDGCCLRTVTISGAVDWAIGELRLGQCKPGCAVGPNSSGNPAIMGFSGSLQIGQPFTVTAFELPHNQFYIFFHGPNQQELPFGNGNLCIAAPITRLNPPVKASATGLASRLVNTSGFPAGDMCFQCWFRDPPAGGSFFDFSDRLKVTFFP